MRHLRILPHYLPEILIVAVATITRFWRLNYHSIWFDEAVSLRWAGAPPFNLTLDYMVPLTFRLIEEKHPPVYYVLLYGWREAMDILGLGQSDAALRSFGALLGVATVLGILLLAHQISGRETARWAALFVALSPVLIWYSQELRMFQPATTFTVWAFYGLCRAWQMDRRPQRLLWWFLMLLGFELALYSYLYSAFVLPAAGFTLIIFFFWAGNPQSARWTLPWQDRVTRLGEGVVALALTGGLFLPLARNAWLVNANESTAGAPFGNFWSTTTELFEIFTLWRENWASPWDTIALCFLAAVGIVGFLQAGRLYQSNEKGLTPLFLLTCIWVPLLLGNVLLASNRSVFKEDRYHIYLVPFVLWAIGFGVYQLGKIRRWMSWGAGIAIAALMVAILPRLWSPALLREDWRAAADYIDTYQQFSPDLPSAGVAHINYTHQPMDWYLQQRYTFEELPIFGLFGDPLTEDMVETVVAPPLNGIVDYGAKTLWLTQSHLNGVDDTGIVESWLRANFPVVTEQYPAGVKLTGFALQTQFGELPALADSAVMQDVELAPGITLRACELMTPVLSARDERLHPPSGWVHVRLWWETTDLVNEDYLLNGQVIDSSGVWGKYLPHEGDAFSAYSTSQWPANQVIRTEIDLNLNPETPTGDYDVHVYLQDPAETGVVATCGKVSIHG